MSLLGLITVKIICFYGLGNILYFFLIINKTEILVLSKKKKNKKKWWILFWLVSVVASLSSVFSVVLGAASLETS